jgi:hypothetical protein
MWLAPPLCVSVVCFSGKQASESSQLFFGVAQNLPTSYHNYHHIMSMHHYAPPYAPSPHPGVWYPADARTFPSDVEYPHEDTNYITGMVNMHVATFAAMLEPFHLSPRQAAKALVALQTATYGMIMTMTNAKYNNASYHVDHMDPSYTNHTYQPDQSSVVMRAATPTSTPPSNTWVQVGEQAQPSPATNTTTTTITVAGEAPRVVPAPSTEVPSVVAAAPQATTTTAIIHVAGEASGVTTDPTTTTTTTTIHVAGEAPTTTPSTTTMTIHVASETPNVVAQPSVTATQATIQTAPKALSGTHKTGNVAPPEQVALAPDVAPSTTATSAETPHRTWKRATQPAPTLNPTSPSSAQDEHDALPLGPFLEDRPLHSVFPNLAELLGKKHYHTNVQVFLAFDNRDEDEPQCSFYLYKEALAALNECAHDMSSTTKSVVTYFDTKTQKGWFAWKVGGSGVRPALKAELVTKLMRFMRAANFVLRNKDEDDYRDTVDTSKLDKLYRHGTRVSIAHHSATFNKFSTVNLLEEAGITKKEDQKKVVAWKAPYGCFIVSCSDSRLRKQMVKSVTNYIADYDYDDVYDDY